VSNPSFQPFHVSKRVRLLLLFALLATRLALLAGPASAALPADPYADAVDSSSGTILNPANAVGAPDGAQVTVVSGLNNTLVLDMGQAKKAPGTYSSIMAACRSASRRLSTSWTPTVG
jgi:hypothetical protein